LPLSHARNYVARLVRIVARRAPNSPMSKPDEKPEIESIAKNRRARHDYTILDTYEAGLVLTGSEVKSLREGRANLSDAYGIVRDGEIFIINLHISAYERASYNNHEPTRTRKLLLHKREIGRLIGATERQGLTLIPLELYFKRGIAKVVLAVGKGKKLHDKRETERERDAVREIARAVRTR
jgi:SsrA-binding protein